MNNVKRMVLIALLASTIIIAKESLSFLPNIELVTFLLITYTFVFRLNDVLWISFIFCLIQMILYGIGMWTPMYFMVWPGLVVITHILKPYLTTDFRLALFSGCFGLFFGLFFSIPYALIDVHMGISYFLNGIFFDLIHAVANYLIMLLLFQPVNRILKRLVVSFIH